MKVWLLSLLVASSTGVLSAQPVDLLQQLYGKKATPTTPVKESEDDTVKSIVTEPIILTLRDRFEASRERLFLSDVAVCKGSQTICDELLGIDIGTAPKPMRYERLARQRVTQLVEKELPGQMIKFEGPDFCQVSAVSSPVNEEAVMKVVTEEFEDAPAGLRVIIQSIRVPTLQMLRHNNYSYKM
ncbi:MAG: hypothetical protein EOP09_13160, partial [Proteobacteria bacterium]